MKLTRIDKNDVQELRDRIDFALEELGREFGVQLHAGNATFNEAEVTFKLKVQVLQPDAGVETKIVKDYKFYAKLHELPPINSVVKIFGVDYKLTGWNTRAKKYPIKATQVHTGKTYKLGIDYVRMGELV